MFLLVGRCIRMKAGCGCSPPVHLRRKGMETTTTELIERLNAENEEMREALLLLMRKNSYLMKQVSIYCPKPVYDRIWDAMENHDFGGDG